MKKLLLTLIIIILCITGFTLYINAKSAGAIRIMHEQTEMQHIISIEGNELNYPFFGLAFHLLYDPKLYEFDHFTLGDFFETSDDPMAFVDESLKKPEIVAGISLKRGQLIDRPEGTFLKLYFNKKEYQPDIHGFVFEHGVFSTFDEERKDITEVEFKSI
ncbi:hypothetical protein ACFLZH_03335 [Patescibacteria group bacterium]